MANLVNNNACETEFLREQVKTLQLELLRVGQEIDTWKSRRDCAINERDKIVLERESVRALCDKLRRERDRKISDLADALRELYESRRQKNEATKELELLKEKFDSAMKANKMANHSNSNDKQQSTTNKPSITCTSQDSAIDVDDAQAAIVAATINQQSIVQNEQPEIFDIVVKRDNHHTDWGFEFDLHESINDNSQQSNVIIVSKISTAKNGVYCTLRMMDQLIRINDLRLNNELCSLSNTVTQLINVRSLINDELRLNIRICRRRHPHRYLNGNRSRIVQSNNTSKCSLQTVTLPILTNNNNNNDYPNQSTDIDSTVAIRRMFGFAGDIVLIVDHLTQHNNNNSNNNILNVNDRIVSVN
ncbi:hypothetical protein BLA29_006377, partial [Euroglyphus maynei]